MHLLTTPRANPSSQPASVAYDGRNRSINRLDSVTNAQCHWHWWNEVAFPFLLLSSCVLRQLSLCRLSSLVLCSRDRIASDCLGSPLGYSLPNRDLRQATYLPHVPGIPHHRLRADSKQIKLLFVPCAHKARLHHLFPCFGHTGLLKSDTRSTQPAFFSSLVLLLKCLSRRTFLTYVQPRLP